MVDQVSLEEMAATEEQEGEVETQATRTTPLPTATTTSTFTTPEVESVARVARVDQAEPLGEVGMEETAATVQPVTAMLVGEAMRVPEGLLDL